MRRLTSLALLGLAFSLLGSWAWAVRSDVIDKREWSILQDAQASYARREEHLLFAQRERYVCVGIRQPAGEPERVWLLLNPAREHAPKVLGYPTPDYRLTKDNLLIIQSRIRLDAGVARELTNHIRPGRTSPAEAL